jgi:penicillin amidase/acyl-homoserine-lactone acylase
VRGAAKWVGLAIGLIIVAAAACLWTPAQRFDRAAIETARAYDARVIRDRFGVPHIYGERDADVAFGLAYAHAEDDWKTFEEVILFSRGQLARRKGREAATGDYLVAALGARQAVEERYDADLSTETKALLEGYAAGLNYWCAERRGRCSRGVAPVSPHDIVAGFATRTPFFYGLDDELRKLFEDDPERRAEIDRARLALFNVAPSLEIGSNAIAVAPSRSADGATRLMVNSHQPYTGPVAWYEARVKSEEGWDMIGGVFPGSPLILHGAGPDLGWAFTVNKPDLVDVYALDVDDPKTPRKYRFDGAWRDFEVFRVTLRIRLVGPFSLPVTREVLRSAHGPVFTTAKGVVAISYAGMGDIRAVEQWRRMNRARSYDEWLDAMRLQGIPSFNVVYADGTGRIAFFHNAAIPKREPGQDWRQVADGSRKDLLWQGTLPFGSAPHIVDPKSGYVVSANHSPFEASGEGDNPAPADFPPHFGVDTRSTNRGIRIQELYGGDVSITAEEFIAYKMDDRYAKASRLRRLISKIVSAPLLRSGAPDPGRDQALSVLDRWNGATARDNRSAALAVRTGQLALGPLLDGEASEGEALAALRTAAHELRQGFGRFDPQWGEVSRLVRGEKSWPLDGGPDTLRAVYPAGSPEDGAMASDGGDSYILYAEWKGEGPPLIRTIHQFGSATLDDDSPHYADQAPFFASKDWKSPPMTLDTLLAEATRDYRPGNSQ